MRRSDRLGMVNFAKPVMRFGSILGLSALMNPMRPVLAAADITELSVPAIAADAALDLRPAVAVVALELLPDRVGVEFLG